MSLKSQYCMNDRFREYIKFYSPNCPSTPLNPLGPISPGIPGCPTGPIQNRNSINTKQ